MSERGPRGDHGQVGERGPQGEVGPQALTKWQTLALFGFVVLAFIVLAFRSEMQTEEIRENLERQDVFIAEICATQPELAPTTCRTQTR